MNTDNIDFKALAEGHDRGAITDVAFVCATLPPDLRRYGWSTDPAYGPVLRDDANEDDLRQISMVTAFLLAHAKRSTTGSIGSYHLKHLVEAWAAPCGIYYVANGNAIAAALLDGHTVVRHENHALPNARIGVRVKWGRI